MVRGVMANEHGHNERTFVEFVTESRNTLQQAEELLSGLGRLRGQRALPDQRTDAEREAIQTLFRCFHSLKGASSFLKLQHTAGLAHAAQSLVDMYRRSAPIEQSHVKLLRQSVTTLRTMLGNIESDHNDELDAVDSHQVTVALGTIVGALRASETRPLNGPHGMTNGKAFDAPQVLSTRRQDLNGPKWAEAREHPRRETGSADQILVDVKELNVLSRLVDDLLISVTDASEEGPNEESRERAAQVQRLTRTLSETIAQIRLVPLRETFADVGASARRVAAKHKGWLEVEMRGEETRVDRAVIAALGGVLTTVVLGAVERATRPSARRRTQNEAHDDERNEFETEATVNSRPVGDDGPGESTRRDHRRNVVGKLVFAARSRGDEVWITLRDGEGGEPWLGNWAPGLDELQRRVASFGGRLEWTTDPGDATSCTVRVPRLVSTQYR